ncbi:MarR family winged helix-turn-helix transcriptional regulator [Pseudoxanthomonas wuyuanensis]|uniref:Transcriptional regulator n=1 Tax=Pseudoxanthomonas wuyuanensis TaxID=1073196 RepID=A0A286D7E3_9GAMM|nr:MarR family winged helix-turn-helix transcriptional regulator [Pseudoxanthomonas wuyuanensis]KAF1721030.1 MarR family transcriptional regulator [Pseudoxanthomonas wuyuanensis]SOD54544.1 transcriptional regulator [Pseudoxanthomonas wuyuanensis]
MAVTSPCTCFHLRRASRLATQVYDHELAAVNLSLNQYSILRRAERQPRRLGELADELGMDRTTLTRNLKPLLSAALLQQTRGEDARQRLIGVTEQGRSRLLAARPYWQKAQRRIEDAFGQENIAQLHTALMALGDRLQPHGGAGA